MLLVILNGIFKTLNPKSLLPEGEGTLKNLFFYPLSLWERGWE